jgi:Uma2 family endonuclease
MTTLNTRALPQRKVWTVADLYRRFGPISFERIRQSPPPGCGTVDDVVRLDDHEDRLCELVDGVLVQKSGGLKESVIAAHVGSLLVQFVALRALGLVAGAGGTIQLKLNLVRIPDASFFSWDRLPGGKVPKEPVPLLIPELAVEVISPDNTRKEMGEKLRDYFENGVRLVWFVRPKSRVVDAYKAPNHFTRLRASMRLDGGDVLPGFSVLVGELFDVLKRPAAICGQKKNGPQPGNKKDGRRRGR